MASFKFPRILYFITGVMPSAEDTKDAMRYGPNTVFRNASVFDPEGAREEADGVAGAVPSNYGNATTGEAAIEKWRTVFDAVQSGSASAADAETEIDASRAEELSRIAKANAPAAPSAAEAANAGASEALKTITGGNASGPAPIGAEKPGDVGKASAKWGGKTK